MNLGDRRTQGAIFVVVVLVAMVFFYGDIGTTEPEQKSAPSSSDATIGITILPSEAVIGDNGGEVLDGEAS